MIFLHLKALSFRLNDRLCIKSIRCAVEQYFTFTFTFMIAIEGKNL